MEANAESASERSKHNRLPSSLYQKVNTEIKHLDFTTVNRQHLDTEEDYLTFVETFLVGLKAGKGLLGNNDQENDFVEEAEATEDESASNASQATNGSGRDVDDDDHTPEVEQDPTQYDEDDTVQFNVSTENATTNPQMDGGDDNHEHLQDTTANNAHNMEALVRYKHRKGDPADDNAEVVLGDYENIQFGQDFIAVKENDHVPVWQYFGDHWINHIKNLHAVSAMDTPPHMTITPHPHQLKGAAQADWSCKSRFRGILIGDRMGLGKTLLAILAMWLCRDQPGFSLVVCPASLCLQWLQTVERSWEEGKGLSAFHLNDSSTTANQLLTSGYDVIVTSYEFLEAGSRAKEQLPNFIQAYRNDRGGKAKAPVRPTTALHSDLYIQLGLPIKRLVLDEAQRVNKRSGRRHRALRNLYVYAVIVLSGTLAHNKWHDFSGLVAFMQGHPFTSHKKFLHSFSTWDYDGQTNRPDLVKMRLLQRFLQAFLIARPSSVLSMGACDGFRTRFSLNDSDELEVAILTKKYIDGVQAASREDSKSIEGGDSKKHQHLAHAVFAQMRSLHPMLVEPLPTSAVSVQFIDDTDALEIDDGYLERPKEDKAGERRELWLKRIEDNANLITASARVIHFLKVFKHVTSVFPGEKVVILSNYVKFLDIIAAAIHRTTGTDSLRFDGTVKPSKRIDIESAFRECAPGIPLLLTPGAGGVGLNIAHASIVIQSEPWWNHNTELQALARCDRQGQELTVKYIRIEAINSDIDIEIIRAQQRKLQTNDELMEPLVRRHDEGPDIRDLIYHVGLRPWEFEEYAPGSRHTEDTHGTGQ